jgi:hypothetical protein
MDLCRLSVNSTGAFFHPLGDQTTIDCRYGETIATAQLPDTQLLAVTGRTPLPMGRIHNARGVAIHNVSNQGTQTQPTAEEAAAMAGKILFVGFGDASAPSLELPPMIPGKTQLGGSQFLWLILGADVWLDTPSGVTVIARVQIFPGADNG